LSAGVKEENFEGEPAKIFRKGRGGGFLFMEPHPKAVQKGKAEWGPEVGEENTHHPWDVGGHQDTRRGGG